jgi:hypothetical protein
MAGLELMEAPSPSLMDLGGLLGLDDIPDNLYMLQHMYKPIHGLYAFEGVHGLAVFSTMTNAEIFVDKIGIDSMLVKDVTFDDAREIVKTKPQPINTVMLVDNLDDPVIHWVR